jgi:hypothetical protein
VDSSLADALAQGLPFYIRHDEEDEIVNFVCRVDRQAYDSHPATTDLPLQGVSAHQGFLE